MGWKTPILRKGDAISEVVGDCVVTVEHVDRIVDPYLAGVIYFGTIIYTGLHATLADARQTAERKANEL